MKSHFCSHWTSFHFDEEAEKAPKSSQPLFCPFVEAKSLNLLLTILKIYLLKVVFASTCYGKQSWNRFKLGTRDRAEEFYIYQGGEKNLLIHKALSESPRFSFMGRIKWTAVLLHSICLSQQAHSNSLLIILHFVNIVVWFQCLFYYYSDWQCSILWAMMR